MNVIDTTAVESHDSRGDGVPTALRRNLAGAVLGKDGEAGSSALAAFLDETHGGKLLAGWFGRDKHEVLADPDVCKALLARDIAMIDKLLGDQVDAILHHRDFKQLEATWRGVELVIDEAGGDDKVRVRLLNATWQELSRDFDKSAEFDQSALFAKVYNDEYGMPGGMPYGLLICDYAVRHRATGAQAIPVDDVNTLLGVAQVAAAAFSPCVVGAAPELFGVPSFSDLSHAQRLDTGFRLAEYQRWQKLRGREESRFVGVALPRILLRDRYRDSSARTDGFPYVEGGIGIDSWLWGNAAFAFGAVAIRAFRDYGWFADITGASGADERGGIFSALPTPRFSSGEEIAYRRPLEVELTDKKQRALEHLGFMSFSPCNFARSMVLLGARSLHAVGDEGDATEQANARLSSMLQYVMCVSRFAHYVKVMARERVGAYTQPAELERYLDGWLRDYTIGNTDAGPELKARYPLAGARLEVRDIPGKPGSMSCLMHLQPHFHFDQVVSTFQLKTEIASVTAK